MLEDRRREKRNWQRRIETEKIQARQRGEEISDEEGRKRAIAKLHRPKLKRLYLPNRYVGAAYDPCFYDGADVELSQRIGARTAHLDHNFGTLSPGKKVDIIMLAADRIPLPKTFGPGATTIRVPRPRTNVTLAANVPGYTSEVVTLTPLPPPPSPHPRPSPEEIAKKLIGIYQVRLGPRGGCNGGRPNSYPNATAKNCNRRI